MVVCQYNVPAAINAATAHLRVFCSSLLYQLNYIAHKTYAQTLGSRACLCLARRCCYTSSKAREQESALRWYWCVLALLRARGASNPASNLMLCYAVLFPLEHSRTNTHAPPSRPTRSRPCEWREYARPEQEANAKKNGLLRALNVCIRRSRTLLRSDQHHQNRAVVVGQRKHKSIEQKLC